MGRAAGLRRRGHEATARNGGTVTAVETDQGTIKVDEALVVSAGPGCRSTGPGLDLDPRLDVAFPDGHVEKSMDMWTFWRLLEGEVYLPDGVDFRTADRKDSPVLHVELMGTPVLDEAGTELKDHVYFYTRYAAERIGMPGLQGGTIPIKLGPEAVLEPYGHLNDRYQADDWFADYYCAAAAQLFGALRGAEAVFQGAAKRRYRRLHAR